MTRHLWVLVVLPWDGFLVSFSVGLFPSGVGCRRLYCGSRIFCRSDWDSRITIELIPVLGNWCCQPLLFEAATWVARSMLSTLVVEAATWVTMGAVNLLLSRQLVGFALMLSAFCCVGSIWGFHGCCQLFCCRGSILVSVGDQSCTKLSYCMIRHRSFSELQWLELIPDLMSLGSVEIHQIFLFLRWISWFSDFQMDAVSRLLLKQPLDAVNRLLLRRHPCWRRSFHIRTCLWYRRWLDGSITSGFCPHCLYQSKGSDSLQSAGSSPEFLLGGHRLQRYSH